MKMQEKARYNQKPGEGKKVSLLAEIFGSSISPLFILLVAAAVERSIFSPWQCRHFTGTPCSCCCQRPPLRPPPPMAFCMKSVLNTLGITRWRSLSSSAGFPPRRRAGPVAGRVQGEDGGERRRDEHGARLGPGRRRRVAQEEGAEAHLLDGVAVGVSLALLVEHLVLGGAAAACHLAFCGEREERRGAKLFWLGEIHVGL